MRGRFVQKRESKGSRDGTGSKSGSANGTDKAGRRAGKNELMARPSSTNGSKTAAGLEAHAGHRGGSNTHAASHVHASDGVAARQLRHRRQPRRPACTPLLRALPLLLRTMRRDHRCYGRHQRIRLVVHPPAIRAGYRGHLDDLPHTQPLQGLSIHHHGAARWHQHRSDKHGGREGQAVGALGGPPVEGICGESVGGNRKGLDTDACRPSSRPPVKQLHAAGHAVGKQQCAPILTTPSPAHLPPPAPCLRQPWARPRGRSTRSPGRWRR